MTDADWVTVIAKFEAKAGEEDRLQTVLEAMVAPTRAEEGCINYDLHRQKDDPAVFYFYENWTTQEMLDAHAKSPHHAKMTADSAPLITVPVSVILCRMVSSWAL